MLVLRQSAGPRMYSHRRVEHPSVPGDLDVTGDRVGQPQEVVREARANAPARRRVPPVLHVPFGKLSGRCSQEVGPGLARFRVQEREHVLELVAEPVCPARLVEAPTGPRAGSRAPGTAATGSRGRPAAGPGSARDTAASRRSQAATTSRSVAPATAGLAVLRREPPPRSASSGRLAEYEDDHRLPVR